jgi:hypothetical protein
MEEGEIPGEYLLLEEELMGIVEYPGDVEGARKQALKKDVEKELESIELHKEICKVIPIHDVFPHLTARV